MPAIGITGGISTGKTTFCECLREILPKATFFDADQAAHDLAGNDPEVKEMIRREFGSEIFSANGDLNRAEMRSIVFADAEKRRSIGLHERLIDIVDLDSVDREAALLSEAPCFAARRAEAGANECLSDSDLSGRHVARGDCGGRD